jgi:hypothetical protein
MFYLNLLSSLARHEVRYLLVGGLAMNLHGVPRMTMDVDILLALDEANLAHFFTVAREMKLHPVLPVQLADLADPAKREFWIRERNLVAFALRGEDKTTPTLDVLIGAGLPFEAAYNRRVERSIENVTISLAAVEDMITLKELAARTQDKADIEHLRRI